MVICISCGIQNNVEAKFCINCGKSLVYQQKKFKKERNTCFGEDDKDPLGWISFGFFVLVVGIVFALNTNVFSDFASWIEQIANKGALIRPPISLTTSAMLFFGIIGALNFVTATIRAFIDKVKRRILSDILSGIALVLFAYLIHLYSIFSLTWQIVLGTEIVVIGLLIITYSIFRSILSK
jgi:hypothetical protein